MPTYELFCAQCDQLKWPTLPKRPQHYICALCTCVGPVKGQKRREQGLRMAQTKKSRQKTPKETPGATEQDTSG